MDLRLCGLAMSANAGWKDAIIDGRPKTHDRFFVAGNVSRQTKIGAKIGAKRVGIMQLEIVFPKLYPGGFVSLAEYAVYVQQRVGMFDTGAWWKSRRTFLTFKTSG
jgi:hypothetical protein|tara:strand:+ start:5229 stop:5546 length:318 start_codon:yes stop_codon:yes gene_type:complete